jgi:sterol desaturase/sphingolipid hydroxylase (fatty acid hydroxylase superfamily)
MALDLLNLGDAAIRAVAALGEALAGQLLLPGSPSSISAMAVALTLAVAIVLRSCRRKRPVPLRVMARALFPRRMRRSRSTRLDFWMFAFNTSLFVALFSWAIISQTWVSALLLAPFAIPAHVSPLSGPAALAVGTVVLFLAAEFASYLPTG